jgi:hypothetical protein
MNYEEWSSILGKPDGIDTGCEGLCEYDARGFKVRLVVSPDTGILQDIGKVPY